MAYNQWRNNGEMAMAKLKKAVAGQNEKQRKMAADKRRNGGGMAYGENIEKKEEMNNEK
jgi:hypothetical protein